MDGWKEGRKEGRTDGRKEGRKEGRKGGKEGGKERKGKKEKRKKVNPPLPSSWWESVNKVLIILLGTEKAVLRFSPLGQFHS